MGYTTKFSGALKFAAPLTAEQELFIKTILPDDGYEDAADHPEWIKPDGFNSYIQLAVCQDKSGIQWDGSEKFYDAVDAVNTVILTMKGKFPDFALTGGLLAQGEEVGDVWTLVIENNVAVRHEINI